MLFPKSTDNFSPSNIAQLDRYLPPNPMRLWPFFNVSHSKVISQLKLLPLVKLPGCFLNKLRTYINPKWLTGFAVCSRVGVIFLILFGLEMQAKRTDNQVFDRALWEELAADADYPFEKEPEDSGVQFDWLDKSQLLGLLEVLKYVLYAVVIALLLYLIYRLANRYQLFFSDKLKDTRIQVQSLEEAEENLRDANLSTLLEVSLAKGDFRIAIRILFLMAIAQMDTDKVIVWKKQKTNFEYLRELRSNELKPGFQRAVWHFERVWYGNVTPDAAYYNAILPAFETLTRQNLRKV
jgi:hypothetical protein